jgi:rubrerythrin
MAKNQALEFALKFEANGTALYLTLASETLNLLGKHLFYSLAGQEVEHARRFDEIYRTIAQGGSGRETLPSSDDIRSVEDDLREFFTRAAKTELKADAGDETGYRIALEMEEKGFAAYKKFASEAAAGPEKTFLEALMAEEEKHIDAIRNVLLFLTGTGDWFENEESKVWSWMNQ